MAEAAPQSIVSEVAALSVLSLPRVLLCSVTTISKARRELSLSLESF